MTYNIFFSVVIPTCNRQDMLSLCLDNLAPGIQNFPAESYEVIVTDDGSISSYELLKKHYPWARWVKGPCKGPAGNRNNGARFSKGKWIVFTDDDCLPTLDWLVNYYRIIGSGQEKIFALEGSIYPDRPFNPEWEECPANVTGGYFWSANITVEKELFFKVKGFDENYPTADLEDLDLYYTLLNHTRIIFVPEAKVIHPVRKINFWKDLRKNKVRAKIWAYHAVKHKERLGYKSKANIVTASFMFYGKEFVKNLIRLKMLTAIKRLYFLVIGIPLLIFNLSQNK